MGYLYEDITYQKIWLELQAMAWNRPDILPQVVRVNGQWRAVLTEAFTRAIAEYGLDPKQFPVKAIVSLVMTFNEGILLERLSGITEGHAELIAMIDRWLNSLKKGVKSESSLS